MIRTVFCYTIILIACAVTVIRAQEPETGDSLPAYRTLYEEGFYQKAISVLDSLVADDSVCGREPLRYLAFCHIARGDREAGEKVFERLLGCDSLFRCDTLLTSPKILEVFRDVLGRYTERHEASDTSTVAATTDETLTDTSGGTVDSTEHLSFLPATPAPPAEPAQTSALATPRLSPVTYLPGLLPGGGGQFLQHEWIKGALYLTAQVASVCGYVWAYRTRQSYFDPDYGWYAPVNETAYKRYTAYAWIGCTVFIGTYTVSAIDYFRTIRKQAVSR